MSEMLRLDKYLADLGVGTRSQVKQMIRKGLISINGNMAKKPEQKVDVREDRITVEGKELQYTKNRYILLHKPSGYVSATEDVREKTVLSLLPSELQKGLFPVGRLDKDTEGLLLLTNDGDLAHRLLSPKKTCG
ncbi:MAG: pseudouridine synthase [Ruminococcus sp.]